MKIKDTLFSSLLKLSRPLVRLLLRYGVSHNEFVEISKRAFVRVAETEEEFHINDRKQTVSRISVLTGINRKEVTRIQSTPDSESFQVKKHNRADRVVNGWLRDSNYQDSKGEPIELSITPEPDSSTSPTFEDLVKEYSGDIPVRAILDELINNGSVKKVKENKLKLCSKAYIPQSSDTEKLVMMGTATTDLLNTLAHNIPSAIDDSRLQLTLAYNDLPEEALSEFKALSEEHAQKTLLLLNDWLAKKDRSVNPTAEGTGRYRAGLGIYYFEEPIKEPDNEV